MTARRWLLVALAGFAILLLAGRVLATLYTDYLWYDALGAASVWRAEVLTLGLQRGISGLLAAAFVFVNLYAVRHSVVMLVLPRKVANIEIPEEVPGRYLMLAVAALALLFGALLTVPQSDWTVPALAFGGMPFGETDPFTNSDLGFFVYWLPFETSLYHWALLSVLLVTAIVVFLYALTPSLKWQAGVLQVSQYVRRHLTLLGAILLVILAWSYRLDAYTVLSSGSGDDRLVTSIDHAVRMPGNLVLAVLTVAAALAVLWAGWTGHVRLAFGVVTALILMSLILRHAAPALVRRFASDADASARERSYVAIRAGYTRLAYGLDAVGSGSTGQPPSLADVAGRVPLWDAQALRLNLASSGAPAPAPVGWSHATAGVIALVPEAIEAAGEGWQRIHLARTLATGADERGAPLRVDAAGRRDPDASLAVDVSTWAGARGWQLASNGTGVAAAPSLSSSRSRVAHAWALQSYRILFGDLPQPHPVILRRRDVLERVRAVAPFFVPGTEIVPALHSDSLYWIAHLYAASPHFPLSAPMPAAGLERTFFRHAAVAVVNAASGRVQLVQGEAADPVSRTWLARFPELFVSPVDLPPSLAAAVHPPIEDAQVRGELFARYGRRGEAHPGHAISLNMGADSLLEASQVPPLALDDIGEPLSLVVPVLAADSLAGLYIVQGGARPRPTWVVPEMRATRWSSALERLADAPAPEREAVPAGTESGGETTRVRGMARIIPVGSEMLVVQPVYRLGQRGAPLLSEVVILSDRGVARGPTLAAGLGLSPRAVASPDLTLAQFRARVAQLHEMMLSAIRRGDWTAFGAAFDSLGALARRGTPR